MKRFCILLIILLAASSLFAAPPFKVTGATDGSVMAFPANQWRYTAGQDLTFSLGMLSLALTADYTGMNLDNKHDLTFGYNLGIDPVLGPFRAGVHLTGDKEFISIGGSPFAASGDALSDLLVTAGLGSKVGIDFAFDGSFEKGYKFIQAIDTSVYWKPKNVELRAGILYQDPQAAADDVGHPNAPASHAGTSFYAKAKVSY